MKALLTTRAPAAVIVIRLMVGAVFVSEGLQKFLFPAEVGAGRFEKIGFAAPEAVASFVACFEIGCGLLVILGMLTRLAVIPLVVIMLTALATTKVPILMDQGFWKMAHEARTDWAMLMGSTFLLLVGGGSWSFDAKWTSRLRHKSAGTLT
jgi:putative oxidoreductase